jgi:hypothetical protein
MKPFLLIGAALGLALAASAAAPQVSNRPPKPDEVGYRPPEGSAVRLNPPSFIWLHEKDAATYTVQWSPRADFAGAATASNFVWNTYTHNQPLAAGKYFWRYRYTTAKGAVAGWSAVRSVTVPATATVFPMPTRAQQRASVPATHPRLFLRPDDLPRLRELAKGKGDAAKKFAEIRKAADRAIAAGPTPEPIHRGSATDKENDDAVKYWWPNREQTSKACAEAENIAFTWMITGEKKYAEAARQWVLHLTAWDPDGPTNFKLNCEAGKVMLYRPARAYDWAWDTLSEADHAKVRAAMQRRIADAWKSGEVAGGTGHLSRPYSSHGNRVWHKVGEAGVAFLGEVPEAETWLDYAVNKFYGCYPIWADDDGGWHEGVSYWNGYMSKAVWWQQYAKSALNIDGLKKPFFAQIGDYPLYIAPPHSPNAGFGDLAFRPPSSTAIAFLEYYCRMGAVTPGGHAGYWRWWMQQYGCKGETGIFGFLYAANLPALPPAQPPTNLPPSKIFHGIGVASLHTTLLDSRDDVHFLLKSSPFGTQSHGHNAHNTFQLNAYGESLLPACVYRDLHGSKFHYQWVHSTRAQNGVLVNGEGQIPHSPAPNGRISEELLTPAFDYVCGDATEAYGGRLTRARRLVVFLKPDVLVLCDDLAAREPATFQFMLHGLTNFTVDATKATLRLERPKAGLEVLYLAPAPLAFRQWDGFEPKPKKEFPNMWHVEAGTQAKTAEFGMLTVLLPHRAGQAADWKAKRIESAHALGVELRSAGRTILIAFRKTTAPATAAWNGRIFTGPVLVENAK